MYMDMPLEIRCYCSLPGPWSRLFRKIPLLPETFSTASRSFPAKGEDHNYSISLGYVEYPTHVGKASDILRYADMALYEVKLRGKHGCLAYRTDFHSSKRTQLGFALTDISNNLPVLSSSTGQIKRMNEFCTPIRR